MPSTKTLLIVLCLAGAGSCSNPLLPFLRGQRFDLRSINGQPLPWAQGPGSQIVEGWIEVNDSVAVRHEKQTSLINAEWTRTGRFTIRGDTLTIDYRPLCYICGPGNPDYPVDTFTVSGAGLLRREVFPPDSIVRYYALP